MHFVPRNYFVFAAYAELTRRVLCRNGTYPQEEKGMTNKGALIVMMHCPPHFDDEFNAWYDTEHIPERLAIPGFETGNRFTCLSGFPSYLAIYDLASPEVIETEAYIKVAGSNFSPWTERVLSKVKISRAVGEQIYPGHLITTPAVRHFVIRLRGLEKQADPMIVENARAMIASNNNYKNLRVFRCNIHNENSNQYFIFFDSNSSHEIGVNIELMKEFACNADVINCYASLYIF
jgi:hypothetical protein